VAPTDTRVSDPVDPVPPAGMTVLPLLPDVFTVSDGLADADWLGEVDVLGVGDPVALAFGVLDPVGVGVGVGVWLAQAPDGVGLTVWLAWALCVGLGFGAVLGLGVAVVLLVPVALVVGVALSVGLTLVVGVGVLVALAVPWLACADGLDDRAEELACAADAGDPVGVGDDEQDGIAVGVPLPDDTPAGPPLPSVVPLPWPDELGAGLAALTPIALRSG
jgi:hypothetical protein